jgi:hypothetical protein
MSLVTQGMGSLAIAGEFSYNIGEIKVETQEVTVLTDSEINISLELTCQ